MKPLLKGLFLLLVQVLSQKLSSVTFCETQECPELRRLPVHAIKLLTTAFVAAEGILAVVFPPGHHTARQGVADGIPWDPVYRYRIFCLRLIAQATRRASPCLRLRHHPRPLNHLGPLGRIPLDLRRKNL